MPVLFKTFTTLWLNNKPQLYIVNSKLLAVFLFGKLQRALSLNFIIVNKNMHLLIFFERKNWHQDWLSARIKKEVVLEKMCILKWMDGRKNSIITKTQSSNYMPLYEFFIVKNYTIFVCITFRRHALQTIAHIVLLARMHTNTHKHTHTHIFKHLYYTPTHEFVFTHAKLSKVATVLSMELPIDAVIS